MEMDGPSRNLDKGNSSSKKKESSVPLFAVQVHFMVLIVCLRACTSSSFRRIRTEDADDAISSNVSMGKMAFS